MMLQPGNSERARVTLPVKEERLAPAKMRYPRTPDLFGEMPAGYPNSLSSVLLFHDVPQICCRFDMPLLISPRCVIE